MGALGSLSYWLFQPEIWLILAIVLVLSDVVIGLNFFVLPVGLAAGIVSAMLYAEQNFWFSDTIILESWREVLIAFAVLAVASVFVIRRVFQKSADAQPDINDY